MRLLTLGFKTYAYLLAQALAMGSSVISVSISALVGAMLAPFESLTTLPYGLQFSGIIVSSYIFSLLMKLHGRKRVFLINTLFLLISGVLGFLSIYLQSFTLNCLTHFTLGLALSGFAYFRFAATDGIADHIKPVAVSMVTLGGVLAAIVAPIIAKHTRLMLSDYEFAMSYLTFSGLAVALFVLFIFVPADKPTVNVKAEIEEKQTQPQKIPLNRLSVAVYSTGTGYMIMGVLMMQTSLKLKALEIDFADITTVIQGHVLAMFLPSFFMGKLITRLGIEKIILAGYAVMALSCLIALSTDGYNGIFIALLGVGLAWNMLYIGGSSLIAVLPGDTHRLQGINETTVAVLNTSGAFSAGMLFAGIGWVNSNILAILILMPGVILLAKNWRRIQNNASEA